MKKHNSMFGMYMYLFFLSNEKNVNLLRGERKKERKKKHIHISNTQFVFWNMVINIFFAL